MPGDDQGSSSSSAGAHVPSGPGVTAAKRSDQSGTVTGEAVEQLNLCAGDVSHAGGVEFLDAPHPPSRQAPSPAAPSFQRARNERCQRVSIRIFLQASAAREVEQIAAASGLVPGHFLGSALMIGVRQLAGQLGVEADR